MRYLLQVLAWGRFLVDVVARLQPAANAQETSCVEAMKDLSNMCLSESPMTRPLFGEISDMLAVHAGVLGIDKTSWDARPERPSLSVTGVKWHGDGIASDVGLPNILEG